MRRSSQRVRSKIGRLCCQKSQGNWCFMTRGQIKPSSTAGRLIGYGLKKKLFHFVTKGLFPEDSGLGENTVQWPYGGLQCHYSSRDDTMTLFYRLYMHTGGLLLGVLICPHPRIA